jgi:hypothetical protein
MYPGREALHIDDACHHQKVAWLLLIILDNEFPASAFAPVWPMIKVKRLTSGSLDR